MYKEYRTIDKTKYHARGAWDSEPDKVQFIDKDTGLNCLIVRNHGGALCGYVGVSKTHPAYQKDYNAVDVNVHGGLTFSDKCQKGSDEAKGVCHVAKDGEDDVWWLGFDCAHHGDFCPGYERLFGGNDEGYKDLEYVTNEISILARQLKDMAV